MWRTEVCGNTCLRELQVAKLSEQLREQFSEENERITAQSVAKVCCYGTTT